jgi:hypothetical protein
MMQFCYLIPNRLSLLNSPAAGGMNGLSFRELGLWQVILVIFGAGNPGCIY